MDAKLHDAVDEEGSGVYVVEIIDSDRDSPVLFGPHLERLQRDGKNWRTEAGRIYRRNGSTATHKTFSLPSLGMLPLALRER